MFILYEFNVEKTLRIEKMAYNYLFFP